MEFKPLKEILPPWLWYKYFFKKEKKVNFNKVELPKVKRKFS